MPAPIQQTAPRYRNVRSFCYFLSFWKCIVCWCWLALNSSAVKWLCKYQWSLHACLCNYLHALWLSLWSLNLGLKSCQPSIRAWALQKNWPSFCFMHEIFLQPWCCPHFYLCHPMTFPEVAQVQVVSEFEAHEAVQLVQGPELSSAGSAFLLCCAVWLMKTSDWTGIQVPDQFLRCSTLGGIVLYRYANRKI